MVCVVAASALPVGVWMPGEGATGGVFEAERLTPVVIAALQQAGIAAADVDSAIFTANPPTTPQIGFASQMAARLGLRCSGQMSEVMNLGISGGLAFDQALADVECQRAEIALAAGVLYQASIKGHIGMEQGIRAVGDADWQAPFGFTPISWYAMDAARYFHESGFDESDLTDVVIKSRRWSSLNPLSQFRNQLSRQEIDEAEYIVDPLRLYDIPQRADGAVCLVLASDKVATSLNGPAVRIRGRGFSHDGAHQMHDRPYNMIDFRSAREAVSTALSNSGFKLSDINIHELYAPCNISEVLVSESVGLFASRECIPATREGRTSPGGDIALNTSGGCLGRGHPPALTGLYGLVELWEQLTEAGGERQVANAERGLHLCELGNYNAALAHVLERVA